LVCATHSAQDISSFSSAKLIIASTSNERVITRTAMHLSWD
jgi:hypothetical protein